jgi:hypothetical protein
MELNNRNTIIYVLQVIAVYNALSQGWKIKKIGNQKYKFTKSIFEHTDEDTLTFLNKIIKLI